MKTTWRKKMAVFLLAAACVLGSVEMGYAGEATGPASDTTIGQVKKEESAGPAREIPEISQTGTDNQPEQSSVENQTGQSSVESQTGQTGMENQTSQAEEGTQEGQHDTEDPAQAAEQAGLVASGGRYLDPNAPMVALTFDDGPLAKVGNRIMDCAEQYNGRVTFFVVGNRIPSYQDEIRRMYASGHEIGNHTYEHRYLHKLNAAQIRYQIDACNQAVAAITGEAPKLVRLPGGNKNNTVLSNISQPIIMWNIDTLDWKTKNADKSVNAVLSKVKDGDVVLMHELYSQSADAAVRIIPALVERGYQLVTVSELAQFRGGVAGGKIYYSFPR